MRLKGPPGNPNGIGATLRLVNGAISGPAREIHAGSGYWSQDSAVQVLAIRESPTQLWVRWPGGRTLSSAIPKGAREIQVDVEGKVQLLENELAATKIVIRDGLVDVRRELKHHVGTRLDVIYKLLLEDREDIRDAEERIRGLESKLA